MEIDALGCKAETIRELIDERASACGDSVFLFEADNSHSLTYEQFQAQCRAVVAGLQSIGLRAGDKVAFMLDNGLYTVQLFLGTMYGGLVAVPLNVRAGVSQLAFTIDHSDVKVILVAQQYAGLAHEALAEVKRPVEIIAAQVDALASELLSSATSATLPRVAQDDLALLMYTSGSVGQPKAAVHSHKTLMAHGRNSATSHQLTAIDRSLLVLPIYHINAECVTLMPTMVAGGSVVVPSHFNVSRFWDWLDDYRCTWSAIVPTIISQLLDWHDPKADLRKPAHERIRFIRSSSAPLSPSLQREFMEKFPIRLIQAMGSSEAGNIFSNPQAPGANKIGTPGKAWGFQTRIINPDGADVAAGQPGEVLIRGDAVMRGYYKDQEQTRAVLDAEGWLHTGDLAYQDEDGYFFIIGRSKELIIKGGMNIAPRQIDEVLESHPAVLEAAAVGVPDRYLGEDLIAYVVLRKGQTIDKSALLSFCATRLGDFKTPTHIHFVLDLPKGPSGKVQRLRLLELEATTATGVLKENHSGSDQISPTAIEDALLRSWNEVLGQQDIGRDSNFFALGGHSLAAIRCLVPIREKLGVVLSLSDFFEHPTIALQASLVGERLHEAVGLSDEAPSPAASRKLSAAEMTGGGAQAIPLNGRTWSHPFSSGQRRIWFFEELAPEVPLYNESEAVRLIGELQVPAIEQALNLIIARHEMLRSTIRTTEHGPEVVVHPSFNLSLKPIDLSTLPPSERAGEVDRLLVEEPRAPYDLANTPGIRATLIRLSPTEHVFILMMHHLVCDWASEGIIWRELSSAYHALTRNETPTLPSLPIQYGDYALWQQNRIRDGIFAEDLDFWAKTLEGAPELLDLPTDRPRPQIQSYRGARQRFRISPDLTAAVRACSRSEKSSLFAFYTAALNVLLYRYSQCEDIVLGIPISERERPELASVIGFLIHTQALRTRLTGTMTFRELLAQVQKNALDLYTHREVPFEQVVDRLRPERSLSYSPIFQVMINWRDQDQHLSFIGLEGLAVESALADARTSKFDLTVFLTDFADEIWMEVEYSTDLFDDDRIARMFAHFETVVGAVADDPGRRLCDLPLLTEAERRQLLIDWNATVADYPRDQCVHQLFEQQVERTPDATAVVYGERALTFRELNRRANLLAHCLRRIGIRPGSIVGLCIERSHEMIVGALGILKAGGSYLPLDPTYPSDRLTFMARDADLEIVVTQKKLSTLVPAAKIVCVDDQKNFEDQPDLNPSAEVGPDDLAYVIYTSGSTGQPKGVEVTHRSVVNLLTSMRHQPGLKSTDTLLAVTTLSFDIAVLELYLPLTVGARLVIAPSDVTFDGRALLELMSTCGATVFQATPITYRLLLDAGWRSDNKRLKALCGGEPLPRTLADAILERAELWNCYGPTETTVWSTLGEVMSGQPITIGRPIANTIVRVLDPAGGLCPIGIPGELYIGGTGLARGYHGRPDLTAERFVNDRYAGDPHTRLYRTGDLVCYRADGSLEHLGRLDYQVKLRGFRIELGEIETILQRQPGVSQAVVVVRPDSSGEKQLAAYLVPRDPHRLPAVSELRRALEQKLPAYMIPSAFTSLESLPLTANGKIDRKALPASEPGRVNSEDRFVAPRTPTEEVLAHICSEVLGGIEIGIRDDFFTLGGNSLQVTQLLAKVERLFNQRIPVPVFFQKPTIESLSIAIHESNLRDSRHQLIRLTSGTGPGSLFFLDAGVGQCRLARLLKAGLNSFATVISPQALTVEADPGACTNVSPSVESMAAQHVALIRSVKHSGPLVLVGHSFGGTIAFEVAHQLQRDGISVDLILLLDAWRKFPFRRRKALLWTNIKTRIALRSRLDNLIERFQSIENQSSTRNFSPLDAYQASDVPAHFYFKLRKNYRHRPLHCRALLFRTDDSSAGEMGWSGLFTRGLEVIDTTGDHWTLLKEPHLQTLALRIDGHLESQFADES